MPKAASSRILGQARPEEVKERLDFLVGEKTDTLRSRWSSTWTSRILVTRRLS